MVLELAPGAGARSQLTNPALLLLPLLSTPPHSRGGWLQGRDPCCCRRWGEVFFLLVLCSRTLSQGVRTSWGHRDGGCLNKTEAASCGLLLLWQTFVEIQLSPSLLPTHLPWRSVLFEFAIELVATHWASDIGFIWVSPAPACAVRFRVGWKLISSWCGGCW